MITHVSRQTEGPLVMVVGDGATKGGNGMGFPPATILKVLVREDLEGKFWRLKFLTWQDVFDDIERYGLFLVAGERHVRLYQPVPMGGSSA